MPETTTDYTKLLTEVIKRQIVILGPDITLAKARNVAELQVADDGTVLSVSGNPQEVIQKLVEQFTELSSLIVKKTMEPLLANYPGLSALTGASATQVSTQTQPQTQQSQPANQQPASQTPQQGTQPAQPVQGETKQ